jgi:CrcB protein
MKKYFFLAAGGAAGTMFRYIVSVASSTYFPAASFPFGTLIVNLSGSFLIGLLAGLNEADLISPSLRMFLLIGVLGGYTTFSTFSLETLNLIRAGEMRIAVMNVAISNIAGIGLAFGGFIITKYVLNSINN